MKTLFKIFVKYETVSTRVYGRFRLGSRYLTPFDCVLKSELHGASLTRAFAFMQPVHHPSTNEITLLRS